MQRFLGGKRHRTIDKYNDKAGEQPRDYQYPGGSPALFYNWVYNVYPFCLRSSLANSARQGLQTYPYKLIFPALMICLIVLSLNLLGDGLRDAFDPKLKR